ncbi:Alpha amylase [Pleurostoma richardsiae]|uniref:Alpha amylase n=1 Tax=Pleurostoma richardsiae TaxID=41990 RepID=A0AA38R1S7_9PEZI|nr:Alpha amylase [Pleurostoma richardsiae]
MRSDELRIPTERVTKTWWKEAIVYQIYPASFFDSDGDGVGDIPGIISKLDYLQGLGVNVLWLSPIYKSPQVDMGYDVSDYRDIHTPYGTLSDVDHLIAELHNRRMKLLMDLVVNHTSDQHAWFKQSRSSKTDPKRDWYIWRSPRRDESGQRLPPNNWSSIFGGSAWQYDAVTDSYYLHLFAAEQPDLNFENPAVREAVHSDMRFWLDRGIDGFRMDSVNLLSKAPGLPDASVSCVGAPYQPAFKHFVNGPRIHEWLGEMNDKVLSNYDLMTVGELPMTPDPKDVLKFVASGRKELNMVFQTDLVDLGFGHEGKFFPYHWKLPELKRIVNKWQTLLAAQDGWNAVFLENHDNGRSVSRFASDAPRYRLVSAKMLAMLLGTLGGTLYLYQGQEIGMKNAPEDWGLEDYIDLEVRKAWETIQAEGTGSCPVAHAMERLGERRIYNRETVDASQ